MIGITKRKPKSFNRVGIYFKNNNKMATIANLKLEIKKGTSKSEVTVSYNLYFSHCERLAESVFIENVTLRGDDSPLADDHLITIRKSCVKATSGVIKRKHVRKIKNSVLNEDDFLFNRTDEVYARVKLTPFTPGSKQTDSNIISGNF